MRGINLLSRRINLPALRWKIGAALVAAGLGIIVFAMVEPLPRTVAGVASVVDGDTLEIDGARVRLAGIDAPELAQTCTDAGGAEWPCGTAASERLGELIGTTALSCQIEERDRYRRLVGVCEATGQDIGALMVREGLALSAERHFALEQDARSARRGIWVGAFEAPADYRERTADDGFFDMLEQWMTLIE